MKTVSTGLGDHVDHRTARTTQLGGISVGIDLKFLHGVLAELIRSATRTSPSKSLAKECVVIVGAIDSQRVQGAALTGKAQIAAAHIACHGGSEQNKIDEVSTIRRQIGHSNIIDGRANLRTRGLDYGCFGRNLYCLLSRGQSEGDWQI